MTQLVQQVLDRRKELDEKTSAIRRKLQTYPDGKLICTRNGRYIKWYHSDGRIQTYPLFQSAGMKALSPAPGQIDLN